MTTGAAEWVWENSRAQNGSLILLLAIAREIERQGNCIMTVLELAGKARLSERAVQHAVRDCEGAGELTVTPRVEGKRSGYALRMAKGADIAPLPVSRGADIASPQNLHPAKSAPQRRVKPQVKAQGAKSAPNEISDVLLTVTGSSLAEVKETPAKPTPSPRDDVERLCEHLADRIAANGSKRPKITQKWRDAARLLIDKDGRTEEQVRACIDWSQADQFWRGNIMSMPTLRDKYDRLRLDAIRKKNSGSGKSRQPSAADYDELTRIARALDAQEAMQ
jgi:hypothetical protein